MTKKKTTKIGLTGSIAVGKSTASQMLADLGALLFCADKEIHKLLEEDSQTKKRVFLFFPEALQRGTINRQKLGDIVYNDFNKLKKLEAILHPLVEKERQHFLQNAINKKAKVVIFDIPLLFETDVDKDCDITICVITNQETQKERALQRKNMTEVKLAAVLRNQMSEEEKKKRSDFVIDANQRKADMWQQIKKIWSQIDA